MSDFSPMLDSLAQQQIRERVAAGSRPRLPARRRRRGRQAWADRLHALADRLDA